MYENKENEEKINDDKKDDIESELEK